MAQKTMKVKLRTSRVTSNLQSQQIGDVVDVTVEDGQRMIERGQAEVVNEEKQGNEKR